MGNGWRFKKAAAAAAGANADFLSILHYKGAKSRAAPAASVSISRAGFSLRSLFHHNINDPGVDFTRKKRKQQQQQKEGRGRKKRGNVVVKDNNNNGNNGNTNRVRKWAADGQWKKNTKEAEETS